MKRLTLAEYQSLIAGALVLSRDEHGDKVLQLPDGRIVKLFRRKRLLSSALWSPYASRFERAAHRLTQLGIRTVEVEGGYRMALIKRDAVIYRPLKGRMLREAVSDPLLRDSLLERFAVFLAELHHKGVYFRAIHFGNVIVTPQHELGLIDISEASFARRPLSINQRTRNFKPLVSYEEDRSAIREFSPTRFVQRYLKAAKMNDDSCKLLTTTLAAMHPAMFGQVQSMTIR